MINDNDIIAYLNNHNFDLRKSGNARWIDQKCTPDVLWVICDLIMNYIENVSNTFKVKDIWKSEYAIQNVYDIFSKPHINDSKVDNEFDKFFAQPISLLCYANILKDISTTNRHMYTVENKDILEYLSRNDTKALNFLCEYIKKVLCDSGLYQQFDKFFEKQNNKEFKKLKETFIEFYHKWTPIKKDFEPKRIFTKVLNPLAYKLKKKGTEKGHLSKTIIIKSDIMYNRDNFRDIYKDKPKSISRQEWLSMNPEIEVNDAYMNLQMIHAIKTLSSFIKNNRNSKSELTEFNEGTFTNTEGFYDNANATQMHHIFPKSDFPSIRFYIENLIALTPNQHYGLAHPKNNTKLIDYEVQKELLIAKTGSIKYNLEKEDVKIFEFDKFLEVLSIGFDNDELLNIQIGDYVSIINDINSHYNTN